jgi:hypothetical protein
VSDDLLGVRLKLERADEHFASFDAEAVAFFASKPYAIQEVVGASGEAVWRIRRAVTPPARLGALIGDAIHNLRAALDHLAWGLVRSAGATPTWRTQFPISQNQERFDEWAPRNLKGASPAAVEAVRALAPWQDGNPSLHRLHRLDIADKHRVLLSVGCCVRDAFLPPGLAKKPARIFPIEAGVIVLTAPAEYRGQFDVRFGFDITLGEDAVVPEECGVDHVSDA